MSGTESKTNVVFGAAGSLGSAIVRQLAAKGTKVRAVGHNKAKMQKLFPNGIQITKANALDFSSVRSACQNASVVYHCVNVPYQKWTELMPTVTDNLLKACEETGSALVFPGNVYVYGRFQKIPATENHPIAATNKKGKLRIELERKLMEAQKSSRAQVVIPRFPDYFGPNVTNRLIKPIFDAVVQGKKASWLGKLDVEHNMVYIDDAAAACVTLGAKEASYGQVWHVPGAGPITGRRFIEMAFEAAGTKQNIGVTSSRMMKFFGLFSSDAREMNELLYEFDEPLVLDGNKFAKAFPSFRYTPYEEAMQKTVEWFRDNSIQPK